MLNRKTLKALAAELFCVEYDRYGTPRRIQGEDAGRQPWIALENRVFRGQYSIVAGFGAWLVEECLATPTQITPVPLHHVTSDTPVQVEDWNMSGTNVPDTQSVQPVQQVQSVQPKGAHPLRGYTVTQKDRVCEAMKRLFRVGLDRVAQVGVFARLLARHLGADVRIRVIEGVTWVLVEKGRSRKAFSF